MLRPPLAQQAEPLQEVVTVHCRLHWALPILLLRPSLSCCRSSCNQVKNSTIFWARRLWELDPPEAVVVGLGSCKGVEGKAGCGVGAAVSSGAAVTSGLSAICSRIQLE